MNAGRLVLVGVCLSVCAMLAAANDRKFLLAEVEFLSFDAALLTSARRLPPIRQMECLTGSSQCAPGLQPRWANCTNIGTEGVDVFWNCVTDVDPARAFIVDTLVLCEPFESNDDVYSLIGSCGLKYILNRTVEPEFIDLRHTYRLEFTRDAFAATWNTTRVPQMSFIGSMASLTPSLLPDRIECTQGGINPQGIVSWHCSAKLNPSIEIASSLVTCEPGPDPAKPMVVLKGSCSVEFDLRVVTLPTSGILIKDMGTLKFETQVHINSPRRPMAPQLACREPCALYGEDRPSTLVCEPRIRDGGDSVSFVCSQPEGDHPPLPVGMRIGGVAVDCSGLHGDLDPFKIPMSCLLRYDVVPSISGGSASDADEPKPKSDSMDMFAEFADAPEGGREASPFRDSLFAWIQSFETLRALARHFFAALALEEDEGFISAVLRSYYELSMSEAAMALVPALLLLGFIGCCFVARARTPRGAGSARRRAAPGDAGAGAAGAAGAGVAAQPQ